LLVIVTSGPSSRSRSSVACGERTSTTLLDASATNSSTSRSAISSPRPTTMRCCAVNAISLIRCEETNTVRPSAARPFRRLRTQRMPSGSRPLIGSSSTIVCGSPSSAEAMPSRCPMPRENPPARLRATSRNPTSSMTSATLDFGTPLVWASASRWL
jgi:hypothetical protein